MQTCQGTLVSNWAQPIWAQLIGWYESNHRLSTYSTSIYVTIPYMTPSIFWGGFRWQQVQTILLQQQIQCDWHGCHGRLMHELAPQRHKFILIQSTCSYTYSHQQGLESLQHFELPWIPSTCQWSNSINECLKFVQWSCTHISTKVPTV